MSSPVVEGDVLAGKYRVERVLGKGGMGVVVAATHLTLGQRVALKFLLPQATEDPQLVARFLREARAAAAIRSEHVARVLDVGELPGGAPYLVMEYLEGRDLAAELTQHGPLPVPLAVDFVLQACEALVEAHALGIVHRDVKPANLFLVKRTDGSPCIKVLDFGIAKQVEQQGTDALTRTTAILGSPLYMSPEQVRASTKVDLRTDVWSLGIVLHELLTGRPAFDATTASALLAMIAADPPTPLRALRPDAPVALEALIARCLEKNVAARTPSVAALARELAPFASERGRLSVERIVGTDAACATTAIQPSGPAPASATGDVVTEAPMIRASNATTQAASRGPTLAVALSALVAVVAVGYAVTRPREAPTPTGTASAPQAPIDAATTTASTQAASSAPAASSSAALPVPASPSSRATPRASAPAKSGAPIAAPPERPANAPDELKAATDSRK